MYYGPSVDKPLRYLGDSLFGLEIGTSDCSEVRSCSPVFPAKAGTHCARHLAIHWWRSPAKVVSLDESDLPAILQ